VLIKCYGGIGAVLIIKIIKLVLTENKKSVIVLLRIRGCFMKEGALEILKRKVYLSDVCGDDLTKEEQAELDKLERDFESMKSNLSEDEKNWLYAGFAGWYDKFMDMETKMFIKPRGG